MAATKFEEQISAKNAKERKPDLANKEKLTCPSLLLRLSFLRVLCVLCG
jgi:hypothetical protein